jgi:hypothetical protein
VSSLESGTCRHPSLSVCHTPDTPAAGRKPRIRKLGKYRHQQSTGMEYTYADEERNGLVLKLCLRPHLDEGFAQRRVRRQEVDDHGLHLRHVARCAGLCSALRSRDRWGWRSLARPLYSHPDQKVRNHQPMGRAKMIALRAGPFSMTHMAQTHGQVVRDGCWQLRCSSCEF